MSKTEKLTLKLDSQAMNTYQQCPRKYQFSFIKNIEPQQTKTALSIGSVFHDMFEFVNKGLIEGKELRDLVLEAANTSKDSENLSIEEKTFVIKRFLEYFSYYKIEDSKYQIVAAEQGFSKILHEDENVIFVYEGRVDCLLYHTVEDSYVWRDYKTHSGRFLYTHTNQFLGYTWAISSPDHKTRGEIDYIGKEKNKTDKTFIREQVKFHDSQVERWKERAIDTYYRIVKDYQFIENMSQCQGMYGVCSFSKLCERNPEIHPQIIQIHYQQKEHWSAW